MDAFGSMKGLYDLTACDASQLSLIQKILVGEVLFRVQYSISQKKIKM